MLGQDLNEGEVRGGFWGKIIGGTMVGFRRCWSNIKVGLGRG